MQSGATLIRQSAIPEISRHNKEVKAPNMATTTRRQLLPQFSSPTFTPSLFYARLTSLAACGNGFFRWNATPWLGLFLEANHQMIVWDRLVRDKNLAIPPKEPSRTATLHLGTTQGNQNIFVLFPNIDMSAREMMEDKGIIQRWTDDVMNAALDRVFPQSERDRRFGTGRFRQIKCNSEAARGSRYDSSIVEPLNTRFLPQLWEAMQESITANPSLSMFRDAILFTFWATELPVFDTPSPGDNTMSVIHTWPARSAEEVLEKELSKWDSFMDMAHVDGDSLHIRGEYRFHTVLATRCNGRA
jgi:hypothetical protein